MHVLISALHRPSKPTGVCRHAANLARCLADTKEVSKVTLLIGEWQRHYFKTVFNLCSKKIDVVSVDFKNSSLARNIWFLWGLPKLANQLHPDIVHLSFPMPFARSRFNCPVVATIHDLYPYECPENFGFPNVLFNRGFLKQCIANCDGLSCVSQMTLKNLQFYFPDACSQKHTSVVYNYVDFSQVVSKIPKPFDANKLPSFLLTVAQHRKNKNLDLLIQSYAQLRGTGQLSKASQLAIVGSNGPETENLVTLIQNLGLENSVLLLSSIDDGELRWLYENCQLFAIASSTEGFCLPLAEAMYLGCTVVCSNIAVFREIGSDNCTYFNLEGDSVSKLTQAIAQTLGQTLPRQDSGDARFSKSSAGDQYLKFYSAVIIKNISRIMR